MPNNGRPPTLRPARGTKDVHVNKATLDDNGESNSVELIAQRYARKYESRYTWEELSDSDREHWRFMARLAVQTDRQALRDLGLCIASQASVIKSAAWDALKINAADSQNDLLCAEMAAIEQTWREELTNREEHGN